MRELLKYLMEQDEPEAAPEPEASQPEDIFKPAPKEELEKRPGWVAEQERIKKEQEAQRAKIEAGRATAQRLGRLATAAGFTPQRVRDEDLRWGVTVNAKRDDGGEMTLNLRTSWRYYGGSQDNRLHVTVNYKGLVDGVPHSLSWNARPVKVVLDFDRTDEQLITALKRRVKALDDAIVKDRENMERQAREDAERQVFTHAAAKILDVTPDEYGGSVSKKGEIAGITASPGFRSHIRGEEPGQQLGDVRISALPLDMFKEVLTAIRDIVK